MLNHARRRRTSATTPSLMAEALTEFALRGDDRSRTEAIAHRPDSTGDPRHDAYLGALSEHLAAAHGLSRPGWSVEPGRFLDRFWFVSEVPGFRDRRANLRRQARSCRPLPLID